MSSGYLSAASSEFLSSASSYFRSDVGQIVAVIAGIAAVLLVVIWLAFATLVALSVVRDSKLELPTHVRLGRRAWEFIQVSLLPLIFILKPLKYLLTVQNSNENYRCPRCDSKAWYMSTERTSNTAFGGIINNPNGPDIGFVQQIPYDESVRRCKNCNAQMDTYESISYRKWANTWQTIGYSLFGLAAGAALPAIFDFISDF